MPAPASLPDLKTPIATTVDLTLIQVVIPIVGTLTRSSVPTPPFLPTVFDFTISYDVIQAFSSVYLILATAFALRRSRITHHIPCFEDDCQGSLESGCPKPGPVCAKAHFGCRPRAFRGVLRFHEDEAKEKETQEKQESIWKQLEELEASNSINNEALLLARVASSLSMTSPSPRSAVVGT